MTLGQVPLQNIEAACEEASRAMRSGHVGIQIGNHVGPMDLDADELVAFLQHCAEDNVCKMTHTNLVNSYLKCLDMSVRVCLYYIVMFRFPC